MRTRTGRRRWVWRDESGQSSVEFLFMLPFLLMVLSMSWQYYEVHQAKFKAALNHRNNAIREAMKYNASIANPLRAHHEPVVKEEVDLVIVSRAFPKGMKVSSAAGEYLYYAGTNKR